MLYTNVRPSPTHQTSQEHVFLTQSRTRTAFLPELERRWLSFPGFPFRSSDKVVLRHTLCAGIARPFFLSFWSFSFSLLAAHRPRPFSFFSQPASQVFILNGLPPFFLERTTPFPFLLMDFPLFGTVPGGSLFFSFPYCGSRYPAPFLLLCASP